MRVVLICVGFYLSAYAAFCQQNVIDSLENLLVTTEANVIRVNILCDLADKYLLHEPLKAKFYAEEALKLSKDINYPEGEILAQIHLGDYEFRQGKYAKAIEVTSKSLHQAESINNSLLMSLAYRVLGNVNNIGLKRYDSALHYQLKAFKIHQRQKDYKGMASVCGSITWIYAMTNQNLEEAHHLANLGIHLSDSLNHPQYLSYNYNSKGLIYMQENKLDSALKYIDLSIEVAKETKDKAVIAFNKRIKADIYLLQRNFNRAIVLFNEALTESRQLGIREVVKKSYEGLAKCYEGLGNYAQAYKYNLLFNELKDSLLNIEITQKALITELEFEEAKREAKITELELANEQERREKIIYIILFGIGLALMLTIVILITRNNRHRIKTNQLLQEKNLKIAEQNLKLQEANETKDKLFSIIGHDLRSPLISLKSMLGLVVHDEVSDQEFKTFAPKLNKQVIGISEMLENLLQWSRSQLKGWNRTTTKIKLNQLINDCIRLFPDLAREKDLIIVNELNPTFKVLGDIDQIQLIFRNVIHNAIKFTTSGGQVKINGEMETNFIKVNVSDNGVGMDKEKLESLFSENNTVTSHGTEGERGTGLGLHLCLEMIEQNGGRIEVTSEVGVGTTFHIFLRPG